MIDPGRLIKACMAALLLVSGALVPAASGRTLISDTEIEASIGDLARPLLDAAGLDPGSVRILVIGSDDLNAFVAGGQNLFLFTGLLMRTENPGQLSGVLAHEIGHIASGHLVRTSIAVEDASVAAILGLVLGTTAAVVSGRADAAAAVLQGTSGMLRANLFAYTRTQESAADQAAVRLLDSTGQSSRGYLEFLQILDREFSAVAGRPAFATTHPLTPDRIAFAEQHLANSPHADAPVPVEQLQRHARMVAKLRGFLLPPEQTLSLYSAGDSSVAARYARAIATFRKSGLAPALALIDDLIAGYPDDGVLPGTEGATAVRVRSTARSPRRLPRRDPAAQGGRAGPGDLARNGACRTRAQYGRDRPLRPPAAGTGRASQTRIGDCLAPARHRTGSNGRAWARRSLAGGKRHCSATAVPRPCVLPNGHSTDFPWDHRGGSGRKTSCT